VAYSRSKFYNVLFTEALAEKVGKRGLVTSLHPGVVRTELMREMMDDGLKGSLLYILLLAVFPLWWLVSKSAYEGCQTTLYTVLSPEAENGAYYADCKKSKKNSHVVEENWKALWKISEEKLRIKFDI
jgi:NAD(P)-dependent dehydrogenase (short-subunit alcohol dehydrogenase family)